MIHFKYSFQETWWQHPLQITKICMEQRDLGVISVAIVLEAVEGYQVTKGRGVDRKEKRSKNRAVERRRQSCRLKERCHR